MDVIERLQNDGRFQINPVTLDCFKKRKLLDYRYIVIPVGKIRRHQAGRVFSLYETDVYRYLEHPEGEAKAKYEQYVMDPINQKDHPGRSLAEFSELQQSFAEYDPLKGAIVVNQFYCVMDGQHRSCLLLKQYGADYRIPVVQIRFGDYKIIGKIRINNCTISNACCIVTEGVTIRRLCGSL